MSAHEVKQQNYPQSQWNVHDALYGDDLRNDQRRIPHGNPERVAHFAIRAEPARNGHRLVRVDGSSARISQHRQKLSCAECLRVDA